MSDGDSAERGNQDCCYRYITVRHVEGVCSQTATKSYHKGQNLSSDRDYQSARSNKESKARSSCASLSVPIDSGS
jgi:hypothetical protein